MGNGCYAAYNATDTARLERGLASGLDGVKVRGNKCWVDLRTMKQRHHDTMAGFLWDVRRTAVAPLELSLSLPMEAGLESRPQCSNTPPARVPPLPPLLAPHKMGAARGAAAGGERGNSRQAKTDKGDGQDSTQGKGTPAGVNRDAGADGKLDACAHGEDKDKPVGTDPNSRGPVDAAAPKFETREDAVAELEDSEPLGSKGTLHKMTCQWAEPLDSSGDPRWRAVSSMGNQVSPPPCTRCRNSLARQVGSAA